MANWICRCHYSSLHCNMIILICLFGAQTLWNITGAQWLIMVIIIIIIKLLHWKQDSLMNRRLNILTIWKRTFITLHISLLLLLNGCLSRFPQKKKNLSNNFFNIYNNNNKLSFVDKIFHLFVCWLVLSTQDNEVNKSIVVLDPINFGQIKRKHSSKYVVCVCVFLRVCNNVRVS